MKKIKYQFITHSIVFTSNLQVMLQVMKLQVMLGINEYFPEKFSSLIFQHFQ